MGTTRGVTVKGSTGVPPVNTVAPVASGLVVIGGSLSTTNGTWTGTPAPTFTYQWRRAAVNIGAATASSYTPVAADIGPAIDCVVTATNAIGSSTADTNDLVYSPTTAAAVVEWWDSAPLTPGTITSWTGTRLGTVLSNTGTVVASATSLNGTPGVTFSNSKVAGALNLSALAAARVVCGIVDTATTVEIVFGYGTPFTGGTGFDLLINAAGQGLFPLTSGSTTYGGVSNGQTLASPIYMSIGFDTAQAAGVGFVRVNGSAVAITPFQSLCVAGNFASSTLTLGNGDLGVAWLGTLGTYIIMSGTAQDNDLLSAEAFVKFKSGL